MNDNQRQLSSSFATWLLDVGNGKIGTLETDNNQSVSWITIPELYYIPDTQDAMLKIIKFIYDDQTLKKPNARDLQQKAIVYPRIRDPVSSRRCQHYIQNFRHSNTSWKRRRRSGATLPDTISDFCKLYIADTMTQNCISDLKPGARNKVLEEFKVYQKWINRKTSSPAPTDYCCILIDREANAIQANMGTHDISYFSSILQDGAAYRISNFICIPTSNFQQTLDTETTLRFGKQTQFESIPSDEFPEHYFNFVGNVVELALWDDMARNFKTNEYDSMEKPVIIAVSSCKVLLYGATLQLSGTPATHYHLNPDIPHLEEFRSQYKAQQELNPPLAISKERYHDLSQEKMRNRFPLLTLMQQNPDAYCWKRK
uniref:Nucleic acid-binding, OB-fold protein n=1 Tax=Tanacetum cinerariifolium TaxID=118510 RepID=A0A699IJS1_TANCI|nr:nucleic acid-binding, OB-fold protein [Tanacetum cinerariifolium]